MIRIHPPLVLVLALCALALAAAPAGAQPSASAAPWRTDVPCTAGRDPALAVADTAVQASAAGCVRADCITLPDGRRVCSCRTDTTIVMRVESGGRTLHEWAADHPLAGDPGLIRVLAGDLDGDGRAEMVVSEFLTLGSGLGVRRHRLSIFDGRDAARAPVRVNAEDFDPAGSFVRPAAGGDCRLIATRWNQLLDARDGWGTYLIGQWMRYRDGRLEHDASRPVVARRLRDGFAAERERTPGAPFAHLAHAAAEARPDHDTRSLPPLYDETDGTIVFVRADTVVVSARDRREFSSYQLGSWRNDGGGQTTSWLADGATRRPYPAGYQPSDPRWPAGALVRVSTYIRDSQVVTLIFIQPSTAPQP